MRRRPSHNLILNLAACVVVLAGTTSTSVRHSHTQGDAPHGHGLGIGSRIQNAASIAPGTGVEPALRHAHVIVFGFECYQGAVPEGLPDEPGVATGLLDPGTVEPHSSAPHPAPVAPLFFAHLFSPPTDFGSRQAYLLRITPPGRASVCPAARGERSGVMLV